jgi:hypothetical protein
MRRHQTSLALFCLAVCGVALSVPSTTWNAVQMLEPDHQKIVDELRSHMNDENYRQNLELMSLRERQNMNIERIKTLEDRFWLIIIGILGTFASSIIGALLSIIKINALTTSSVYRHEPRESWDGHERRRQVRQWPPENDRRHQDSLDGM